MDCRKGGQSSIMLINKHIQTFINKMNVSDYVVANIITISQTHIFDDIIKLQSKHIHHQLPPS